MEKSLKLKDKSKFGSEMSNVKALSIILIFFNLLIYELGFCNLKNLAVEHVYNFSLYRFIVYLGIAFLIKIFGKNFFKVAEDTFESKKKIFYAYLIFCAFLTIFVLCKAYDYYTMIMMFLAEINGLLFIMYIGKDYIKNIIITTLTIGVLFSIVLDCFHLVDDKRHFMSSLNIAMGNFNFKDPITEEKFNSIPRRTQMSFFIVEYFKIKDYKMIKMPTDADVDDMPAEYNPIEYIPAAIGINITRFFGGSFADAYITGRIINLFIYALMLIIMFKILPLKKDTFYCIFMIPFLLALSASYSVDGYTAGTVGIFIAYILKLYVKKDSEITFKDTLIALLIFAGVLLSKGGSYLTVCFMILILPIIKIIKNNKKILITLLILGICTLVIGLYKYREIATSDRGDLRAEGSSPKKQIEFLLSDPTNIVKVYCNYTQKSIFNLQFYNELNQNMVFGWYGGLVSVLMFVYILNIAITDSTYTFKNKEKLILITSYFLTYFVTTFIMYIASTEVGAFYIEGYQARYIIPILPFILICINSKNVIKRENSAQSENNVGLIMGLFMLLDVFTLIL